MTAIGRNQPFVVPDLIRDPWLQRGYGYRIKSAMTKERAIGGWARSFQSRRRQLLGGSHNSIGFPSGS